MTIQQLYEKRDFVRYYIDKAPDKQLVNDLITTTYNLVPSKQNLVPYGIHVWGPDKDKQGILQATKRDYHKENHNEQLLAPYLVIFTTRLVTPNKWVQLLIDKGHGHIVTDPKHYQYDKSIKNVMLEVGMFTSILTGLCMENDIDTGYTLCQFPDPINQTLFEERVLFIMSLGYRVNNYSKQWKQQFYQSRGETKPAINDVITYY